MIGDQVHFREPGLTHKADTALESRACAGRQGVHGHLHRQHAVDNPDTLDGIFRHCSTPIITHREDTPMIDALHAIARAKYGADIPAREHPLIRSREACIKSTRLAISLARKHGTRLHVLHISTADELALFEPGPMKGKKSPPRPACISCTSTRTTTSGSAS